MITILDRLSATPPRFSPSSVDEFFALVLAKKMHDPAAARHLADLVSHSSRDSALAAYRRALSSPKGSDRVRHFALELERRDGGWGGEGHAVRLMAVRIERRSISVALFSGEQLEYAPSLQLSSVREKALESALAFMQRTLNRYSVESAALEIVINGHDIQRRALTDAITSLLREQGIPLWEIAKNILFDAYASPSLRFRKQLRQVICAIWPELRGTHTKVFLQDAVALGLYVQIERLFIN